LSGNGALLANTACIDSKLSYDIASKKFLDCRIARISVYTNSGVTKFPAKIIEFPSLSFSAGGLLF